jgi:membrane protein
MNSSPDRLSRSESMASWAVASMVVASAVVYAMALGPQDRKRKPPVANPTPAQEPLALQRSRAEQAGRGRRANAPTQIPWLGWRDIIVRTYQNILENRLLSLAAGIVFYSLVALFPAIAAGVSSYALFSDAGTISKHLALVSDIVPASVLDIIGGEITRIAEKSDGKLTLGFLVGFVIALWSANAGIKAMFDALNIIYDEEEKRGIIRLNAVSLFFTLCAIGGALLTVTAVVVFPLILAGFGLSSFDAPLIGLVRWPLLFVLVLGGLAVVYRYGPSRRLARWRWISVGSVLAAVVWLAVSSLFSFYLGNFANYNATYGALGAVVGLMMWMWLSAIVVLAGAQLNSEIEHQTARDSTVGPEKPLGLRGAVMADTVGAALG